MPAFQESQVEVQMISSILGRFYFLEHKLNNAIYDCNYIPYNKSINWG